VKDHDKMVVLKLVNTNQRLCLLLLKGYIFLLGVIRFLLVRRTTRVFVHRDDHAWDLLSRLAVFVWYLRHTPGLVPLGTTTKVHQFSAILSHQTETVKN
jgi:hypothetical protein